MNEERRLAYERGISKILRNQTKSRLEQKKAGLTESQLIDIKDFYDAMLSGKKYSLGGKQTTSYGSYYQYLSRIRVFGLWLGNKEFIKVDSDDILAYLKYNREHGRKSAKYMVLIIKIFLTWLHYHKGLTDELEMPRFFKDYDLRERKRKHIDSTEVLTPSEIKKLITKTHNPRDKLLISLLFESACRVSEITDLDIKDVSHDNIGAFIKVEGKTGIRRLRLVDSVPYLTSWVNNHPYNDQPSKPLFFSVDGRSYGHRLTTLGVTNVLRMAAKRAGINKRVNPHWFRHSGLDYLARQGFNERDLKIRAGWSKDSNMPSVYLHYEEDEVNNKYAELKGQKPRSETVVNELEPVKCPRCERMNPVDSLYCNCGMVLSLKEAANIGELREKANTFTEKLLKTPISKDADLSNGLMETIFQNMKSNPILLNEFKKNSWR